MIDLKIKYGQDLYSFNLDDGTSILFRLLSFNEYKALTSLLKSADMDPIMIWDFIWRSCVLEDYWKKLEADMPAGLIKTLAELIIFMSGPTDQVSVAELLEAGRRNAMTLEMQMKSVICRVFPSYTIDSLDLLQFNKMVQLFALAERTLLDSGVITEPYQIISPEASVKPGKGVVSSKDIKDLEDELN